MNRLLIFYLVIGIFISCNRNSPASESLGKRESKNDSIIGSYPRHLINYTDSIIIARSSVKFDTITTRVNCKDTIVSFRINPTTKKVIRLCSKRNDIYRTVYILTESGKIEWNYKHGSPNEFIGPFLFSDIYRGGENGGEITKMKFKIANNKIQYIDSIQGGRYSEGAGTWEWLISNTGDPKAIVFNGGDLWSVDGDRLLITPEVSTNTYLVDLQKKDTILSMPRPGNRISNQLILQDRVLFSTQTDQRTGFLELYDFNGKLLWIAQSDYFNKLMVVPDKNLIIGSGYYFPKEDNFRNYFTIAYDLQTGGIKWSFSTTKAYNPTLILTTKTNLDTSSLFTIGDDIYGMVIGVVTKYFAQNINHNNKLILFNSEGQLLKTVDLSNSSQNYSVVTFGENEFEIVSNYETRRFKIYEP